MMLETLIIVSLVASGIFMAGLGLYGRRFSGRVPAALPYSLLMAAAAAWAFLYALDLLAASLPLKVLFHNLRFLFLAFIPFLELWLVVAYVKKNVWLRKDWAVVLLIIPALAAILAITSPFHTIFRYNFSINTSGPVPVLQYQEGPFYQLYFIYNIAILIVAYIILINESRKQGTFWNVQTILLLIALIFPTVINYLFAAGISPVPGVNMTAPLLWIAAILYTVAIFRYRLLDVVPVARNRLIETMSTPLLVLDMDGRIIDQNPAARSFFSIPDSALQGRQIEEIVRDWPEFLAMTRSAEGGAVHLSRVKEGGVHTYIGSADLFHTPDGEPEGRLVILRDVTEQKRSDSQREAALEALRETNAYLGNLLDYANAPIIVWDPDFRITRFNHAFERLTGCMTDQVLGKRVDTLFPAETRDRSMEYLRQAMTGERWETVEIPILRRNGGVRIVLWNSATLYAADGKTVIAAIAQGQDITERKEAEDALRVSEERFRLSFEQASIGMSLTSPDGQLEKVNYALCEMLGYTAEELQAKGFAEITHPDDLAESRECVRSLHAGERRTWRMVKRYIHRDGRVVWADVSTMLLHDRNGNTLHFVTHIVNVTERIAAEHQREALIQELEEKNAELERFTYTVSHDLKSPLITIRGFLGLLREDALQGDTGQLDRDISRISSATDKMQALLSDLLTLSRIGRVINPPERVNFATIAEEARELLAGTIREHGVTVTIAPGLPDVFVDRTRIREVLTNLIENAIKFRGDQQEPLVEIGVYYEEDRPVFFVRDNGIGIEPQYLTRIFNLFEKLDPKTEGTGVGLPIVKRIIEVHGGTIWVESAGPGQGTTFWFTLPPARATG